VQELQQNVEEFQREAKAAADGPHMPSTAKLKQLIDQGQNLGVELSECKPLKWVTSSICHVTQLFQSVHLTRQNLLHLLKKCWKVWRSVKLCSNRILQFLTKGAS